MEDRLLDYIALGVLIFVVLTIIYGGMYIHDIPYQMAKKRNHPHKDAIHTACWVSLFLLHVIWPFLWIWASLYKPDVGWNLNNTPTPSDSNSDEQEVEKEEISSDEEIESDINLKDEIQLLEQRISILEDRLKKEEE